MRILFEQLAQANNVDSWLMNPWVLALVPTIISGIIVNFVSRLIWSRRDNKELRQKVDAANSEILYALRPSVAEGAMPSKDILEALIAGTARKNYLKPENLMTINEFADELVKEVMNSTFISHEQKIKFSSEVIKLKDITKHKAIRPVDEIKANSRLGTSDPYYIYRTKQAERSIQVLTLATVLITLMAAILSMLKSERLVSVFATKDSPYLSIIIAASILPLMLFFYSFLVRFRKKAEHRRKQDQIGRPKDNKHK